MSDSLRKRSRRRMGLFVEVSGEGKGRMRRPSQVGSDVFTPAVLFASYSTCTILG